MCSFWVLVACRISHYPQDRSGALGLAFAASSWESVRRVGMAVKRAGSMRAGTVSVRYTPDRCFRTGFEFALEKVSGAFGGG